MADAYDQTVIVRTYNEEGVAKKKNM